MNQPLSQSYRKSVSGHSTGRLTFRSYLNHRKDCVTRDQSVNALWRNTVFSENSIQKYTSQSTYRIISVTTGVTHSYKEYKKNKVTNALIPRNLFWLRRVYGTRNAADTHQTPHLSICPTVATKPVFRCRRNWYQVSVTRRWQLASRQHLL